VCVAIKFGGAESSSLELANRPGKGVIPSLGVAKEVDGKVFEPQVVALEQANQPHRSQLLLSELKRGACRSKNGLGRRYPAEEQCSREGIRASDPK
jgi:hypothetical protein